MLTWMPANIHSIMLIKLLKIFVFYFPTETTVKLNYYSSTPNFSGMQQKTIAGRSEKYVL